MVQLIPLHVDTGAADGLRQAFGEPQRAWPAHVVAQIQVELGLERRVPLGALIRFFDRQNERHECFGHEPAAEATELAPRIGPGAQAIGAGNLVHGTAPTGFMTPVLLRYGPLETAA